MTYQAASGAGAQNMRELLLQMGEAHLAAKALLDDPASSILDIDREVAGILRDPRFPTEHFGVPLAGSLIPWIDKDLGNGMSREEWKGGAEPNKILGRGEPGGKPAIPVESICVRIGAMRCHSQALTIKLREDLPLARDRALIGERATNGCGSCRIRATTACASSRRRPSPGRSRFPIGRLRKLAMGPRLPRRVHRRRPAAVGRRRAAAPHAAHSARALSGARSERPCVRIAQALPDCAKRSESCFCVCFGRLCRTAALFVGFDANGRRRRRIGSDATPQPVPSQARWSTTSGAAIGGAVASACGGRQQRRHEACVVHNKAAPKTQANTGV